MPQPFNVERWTFNVESSPRLLNHLQPTHRPGARRKSIRLYAKPLQGAHEEIRERVIVRPAEGEVLAVFETTSGNEHGQMVVRVGVRIPHAGAVDHGGLVEEGVAAAA